MKRVANILFLISLLCLPVFSLAQALEVMPGTERVFVDLQWLKPLKQNQYDWTVFSRTRFTADYENQSDVFSALYLNYTSKWKIGPSVVGSVSNTNGVTASAGLHFVHNSKQWLIFSIISTQLRKDASQSFFTIARYRPDLTEKLKLYTSLEVLSAIRNGQHLFSLQRTRIGLERAKWQFGLALNLSQAGLDFVGFANPGVFVRKEF